MLDIEAIEQDVIKSQQNAMTYRLYHNFDVFPVQTQKAFRQKYSEELIKGYPKLFPRELKVQ
jgi:hypothetical protein